MENKILDKNKIHSAFIESVQKSFGDMFFLDLQEIGIDNVVQYTNILYIKIFKPFLGTIQLYLSNECKLKIIKNIYDSDYKTLPINIVDDCLLELLNIITGKFLSTLYPSENSIDFDLPTSLFDREQIEDNFEYYSDFVFEAEGSYLRIRLSTDARID